MMALLEVLNLTVRFPTRHGAFTAVEDFDVTIDRDESLAIVGESGSGKSVAMLAVMGLLPPTAEVSAEAMRFDGRDLTQMSARARRDIAGKDIAMIFQEPMSSLNPCFTVGFQIGGNAEDASLTRRAPSAGRARSRCCATSASPIPSGGCTPSRISSPAA